MLIVTNSGRHLDYGPEEKRKNSCVTADSNNLTVPCIHRNGAFGAISAELANVRQTSRNQRKLDDS